jgi:hypothetical protein
MPKYAPIHRLLESLAYNPEPGQPAPIYLQAAEEEAEDAARAQGEDEARSGQPVRARLEGALLCVG